MADNHRILIAVDGSPASRRAVEYVADLVGGKTGFHVGLCHEMPEPHMLEWGGAEDPAIEKKVEDEREKELQETENDRLAQGKSLLARLEPILADSGVDVAAQLVEFDEPTNRKSLAHTILAKAAEKDYGTVVIGRHAFVQKGFFSRHHLSDELVKAGDHVAIWIVE